VSQQHGGKQGRFTSYTIHIVDVAGHTAQCLHIPAFGGIVYSCPIAQSTPSGNAKAAKRNKIHNSEQTKPEQRRAPTEKQLTMTSEKRKKANNMK
jgi:hypothetical protein